MRNDWVVSQLVPKSMSVEELCRSVTYLKEERLLLFMWEGKYFIARGHSPYVTFSEEHPAPEGAIEHAKVLLELFQ